MRMVFVVRFKANGKTKRYKTTAESPKKAAARCRGGRVLSVRKA